MKISFSPQRKADKGREKQRELNKEKREKEPRYWAMPVHRFITSSPHHFITLLSPNPATSPVSSFL
jgi:hypothetical protein